MKNILKILYTTREAAEALPHYKNSASVKARINEGRIKAEKVGRDWFIPAHEIERLRGEYDARKEQKVENSLACD